MSQNIVSIPKVRAVILDFDGVINDSGQKGLERIVQIVRQAGHDVPRGIIRMLKNAWGTHGARLIEVCFNLDPTISRALYKEWERMDATLFFPLVKGSKIALTKLKHRKKLKIGMLTSRNRENLSAVLNNFNLFPFFDCVQAKDDWPFVKPDPRSFDHILNQLGVSPNQCVYVGDTPVDYEAANKKGVPNISVLSGIFNKEDFLVIGQKEENIIPSIAHLPKWLSDRRL